MHRSNNQYLVLYGSLMKNMGGQAQRCITNELTFIGQCEIKGALYDLGSYPGLVLSDGTVKGELYKITDLSILTKLDNFERFYPDNHKKSLYIRTEVALLKPKQKAWIYVYNQPVDSIAKIESGDWYDFIRNLSKVRTKFTK